MVGMDKSNRGVTMSKTTALSILKIAIVINMIAGGLAIAAGSHPSIAGIANLFFDTVIWPFDGAQTFDNAIARLAAAIGGGGFFGWGIATWMIVTHLAPRDPALARKLILTSVSAWFCVDSLGSLLAGAPVNALVNIIIWLSICVPAMICLSADRASKSAPA
jgi:hypothetical protein